MKLIVESFTCDERRRHQILDALKISESRWKTYVHRYKDKFVENLNQCKSLQYTLNELQKEEFNTLKRVMKDWLSDKKCRADVTIYREAKKCIFYYDLDYLKTHWEPSENENWFRTNVICGKPRPYKKFRVLYEWVEDEIEEHGSILCSEVRQQAGILIGEDFGSYKKFARLAERMKKFLGLKAVGNAGAAKKWIEA